MGLRQSTKKAAKQARPKGKPRTKGPKAVYRKKKSATRKLATKLANKAKVAAKKVPVVESSTLEES